MKLKTFEDKISKNKNVVLALYMAALIGVGYIFQIVLGSWAYLILLFIIGLGLRFIATQIVFWIARSELIARLVFRFGSVSFMWKFEDFCARMRIWQRQIDEAPDMEGPC